jgi:hypothetical protein
MTALLWTKEYDELVLHVRDRCYLNMQMQTQSSYYFRRINDFLTYPILVLSAVSSAALLTSDNEYLRYVSASINVFNTVLITVVRNMRPDNMQQQHAECGRRFQEIIDNLDMLNAMGHNLRPPPDIYLEKIANEMSAIAQTQIPAPMYVMRLMERKFKTSIDNILYIDIQNHIRTKLANRINTPRSTVDDGIPSTPSRSMLSIHSPRIMLSPLHARSDFMSSRSSIDLPKLRRISEDGKTMEVSDLA